MGCVSSKLFRKQLNQESIFNHGGECVNHVVSLTSSTYGVLKLDEEQPAVRECVVTVTESKRSQRSPLREDPEVIDAWELMDGLEEGLPLRNQPRKSPKTRIFLRGFADMDARSPLKFLNQMGSPRKAKRFAGKENRGLLNQSPKQVFRVRNSPEKSCKAVLSLRIPPSGTPMSSKTDSSGCDSSRRKSFSPLFDPELVATYERELSEEEEQIKRVVQHTPKRHKAEKWKDSESLLEVFEKKCPPGGENSVVLYITTLRGIRKTFEDCNTVRSIMESHQVHIYERDVSMDSGFKEELRKLLGTKEVKVPAVFVKGRLVGGVEQVMKLEEEGQLGVLLNGIPRALGGCRGCGGVRFVMCMRCNGSCKVLDRGQNNTVRCGQCNENGLLHCPLCTQTT